MTMHKIISLVFAVLMCTTLSAQTDKTFNIGGVSFTMKYVKGGTYMMGATKEMGKHDKDEVVHRVSVKSFYLGETEVTQELWETVMGKNPSKFHFKNNPVEWITWNDCQDFIKKLNAMTGQKFRLPMEAEWEYAARGGCKSKHYRYAGSNNLADVAWNVTNTVEKKLKHQAVKMKKPNELGLYDMTGNVSEWCQDYYVPYGEDPLKAPSNLAKRGFRVIRGGSYSHSDYYLRISNRNIFVDWRHDDNLGLRLAL